MTENDLIDMEDETVRFAVSWVAMRTCQVGTSAAVTAWNHHSIPGTISSFTSCCRKQFICIPYAIIAGLGIPDEKMYSSY